MQKWSRFFGGGYIYIFFSTFLLRSPKALAITNNEFYENLHLFYLFMEFKKVEMNRGILSAEHKEFLSHSTISLHFP